MADSLRQWYLLMFFNFASPSDLLERGFMISELFMGVWWWSTDLPYLLAATLHPGGRAGFNSYGGPHIPCWVPEFRSGSKASNKRQSLGSSQQASPFPIAQQSDIRGKMTLKSSDRRAERCCFHSW
jgi:hypothetical protein